MSSLKKALGKLKGGNSNHTSDAESDGPTSPRQNGAVSPRASGIFSRASNTFPRGSNSTEEKEKDKDSLTSPRASGIFTRGSIRVGTDTSGHGHSASHSPVRALRDKLLGGHDSDSGDSDPPLNRDGERMSRNQQRKHEKRAQEEARKLEMAKREEEQTRRRKEAEEKAMRNETPEMRSRYGELPVNNYAGEWKHEEYTDVLQLTPQDVGKEVVFRARVHNMRKMSAKLVFIVLRQRTSTIQGVLQEHGQVSAHFVYWAEHIDVEDVVLIRGIVQEPKAKQGEIIGASIKNVEISIHSMHVQAQVSGSLPFTVHEAEVPRAEVKDNEDDHRHAIPDRTRWSNRILDLRTTSANAVFRIQSGIGHLFREYLDSQGFIEIHTPKLQGGATESGASVFKIDYFGRPAFLAQSPQLAKQMAISADFGRVYEIGAVFRAENSNTHRHLTEYTGLDLEMAIDEHYHEVLRMLDRTFKYIYKGLYERYRHEIDVVKRQFPHEDLLWIEDTPRIPFKEGIKMLNDSGWRDEHGNELPEDEDLGTRDEIELGRLVREKYKTDYYILDKFPASARPFYTMPDPNDPSYTNSFDIFLRGQEILSGGQRIHDADMLLKNMERMKIDPRVMEEYVNGFEWGAPPHGGGGIGLERILMLFLKLGDIRHGSLFHRDPKSLPFRPPVKQLRHPEASTMHPPWEGEDRVLAKIDFQPIEKLIANYGDATNTSWLEPRIQIWRDENTGAAVGYQPIDGYAITVGDPLCHSSQYTKTISGYLRYIKKERNLKPLWLLVGADVEEVLAEKFNWRTFSCVAEQRMNPADNSVASDHDLARKIRHAEKEGIKIIDIPLGTPVPEDVQKKCDDRIQDWLAGRKGKQVHLTDIHPWQDMEHRQYHYAITKEGVVAALVVMAQLSPDHGWQVKYSLDFPNSPSGTIEMIVLHALKKVAADGCTNITFGGGAMAEFKPGHNLKGTRVKVLSRAYQAIASELKLTRKTEFREKLGTYEDPAYICYPPHGLGPLGVKTILSFFEDQE